MSRTTFDAFRYNVHSQNGEDGILAELIRRLGIAEPGVCVEFGAGDGVQLSNTLRLTKRGWRTFLFEQNQESFGKCCALAKTFPEGLLSVVHTTVGFEPHDGLDALLRKQDWPRSFDVLSIDVDSYDLQVWRAITQYRPKIVIIEINSGIPLGVEQVHGDGMQGASFTSMLQLGKEKGYTLVCHTGNLIFVANEYADMVDLAPHERADPNVLFDDMWARWAAESK